jgi:hypothetical protein
LGADKGKEDKTMLPAWLEDLAKAYLALSFLCAGLIARDLLRHPQRMGIMNVVWPVTALYGGPAALWAYWAIGHPSAKEAVAGRQRAQQMAHAGHKPGDTGSARGRLSWRQVVVGVTHCGAGCTLGDIIGEWLVFALGWALFGRALYADYFVDFGLAYVLGVLFQYFSIAPMRGLGLKDGFVAAIKADTISLIAFEIGLFAWMALSRFVLFPQESAASWTHWFMMQIGMIIGFLTSYPANWWLIRKGVKEAM